MLTLNMFTFNMLTFNMFTPFMSKILKKLPVLPVVIGIFDAVSCVFSSVGAKLNVKL